MLRFYQFSMFSSKCNSNKNPHISDFQFSLEKHSPWFTTACVVSRVIDFLAIIFRISIPTQTQCGVVHSEGQVVAGLFKHPVCNEYWCLLHFLYLIKMLLDEWTEVKKSASCFVFFAAIMSASFFALAFLKTKARGRLNEEKKMLDMI